MAFFEYTVRLEADSREEADRILSYAKNTLMPAARYFRFSYEGKLSEPEEE